MNNLLNLVNDENMIPCAENIRFYADLGIWNGLSLWNDFKEAGQAQFSEAGDANYKLAVWARTTRHCIENAEYLQKHGEEIPGGPHDAVAKNLLEQAAAALKAFEHFQGNFKSFSEPE